MQYIAKQDLFTFSLNTNSLSLLDNLSLLVVVIFGRKTILK